MSKQMKYLGVILDPKLTFFQHFIYIRDKVAGVTQALTRIMPNLRGPGEKKRRLYVAIIESIVMYGAPVWGRALMKSKPALRLIGRLQRPVANRVCVAYRTVSRDAAMLLARQPPYELVAEERLRVYERCAELRSQDNWSMEDINRIKKEERLEMQREWIGRYDRRDVAGVRTRDAIIPNVGRMDGEDLGRYYVSHHSAFNGSWVFWNVSV